MKFPVDAQRSRVVRALQSIGFEIIREREHIAMIRRNIDGTTTPLTMPITRASRAPRCGRSALSRHRSR